MSQPHVNEPDPAATPAADDAAPLMEAGMREEAARSVGKERRMIALLVVIVAGVMVLAHFTPLAAWLEDAQQWKQALRQYGVWSHLGFILVSALVVMVGAPRLSVCGAAGVLFGSAQGFIVSLIGSTLGSYLAFLGVRYGFRRDISSALERRPWLERMLRHPSVLTVFWVRQLMLPGIVLNALLGLSSIRHRTFLLGTLLGYMPLNLAASLIGSAIAKDSLEHSLGQLMAALAVINLAAWLVWRKVRGQQSA
ncbi:MAG: TVP38/TMEM64 family protein, partial [Verrucomicrobiales bacterium]|nr:TVP38/TMEM64 family protein [Verrucomicrobiales bacterium]